MRKVVRLDATTTRLSVDLDFRATHIDVRNWTGSAVYVRVGAPDIPDEDNADLLVPAALSTGYPVSGTDMFGIALADVGALANIPTQSGLFSTVTITFLSEEEKIPAYGSSSFLSLSISELTNGFQAYTGAFISPTFNIGAWGGALVTVFPDAVSAQAILTVNVTDGVTPSKVLGQWAVWPSIPLTLQIPRTVKFFSITMGSAGIPGEGGIQGSYHVRATIEEIINVAYTPSSTSISKAYNVPNLSTQSFVFVTRGIESVSVGLNNTSGNSLELVFYAGQTTAGPWRLTSFREQSVSGTFFNSIYRSIGNLDYFLRVDVLEIGNTGPVVGTLTLNTPTDPDLTQVMSDIYRSIGDPQQPVNVNQSVYHQLASIFAATGSAGGAAGSLNLIGQLRSILTALSSYSSTGGVPDNTYSSVRDIGTIFDTSAANTVIGRLKNIALSLSDLPFIRNALTVFDTFGGTPSNTYTQLDFLRTVVLQRTAMVVSISSTVPAAGLWTASGVTLRRYVRFALATHNNSAAAGGNVIGLAVNAGGTPIIWGNAGWGTPLATSVAWNSVVDLGASGLALYVFSAAAGTTVSCTVYSHD